MLWLDATPCRTLASIVKNVSFSSILGNTGVIRINPCHQMTFRPRRSKWRPGQASNPVVTYHFVYVRQTIFLVGRIVDQAYRIHRIIQSADQFHHIEEIDRPSVTRMIGEAVRICLQSIDRFS